jgi:hypothetical protein
VNDQFVLSDTLQNLDCVVYVALGVTATTSSPYSIFSDSTREPVLHLASWEVFVHTGDPGLLSARESAQRHNTPKLV